MAIEFFNIVTGERKRLTKPHQIGAFINSSDLGENSDRGQDFGWRIAPEQMVRVEELKSDPQVLREISQSRGIDIPDIKPLHLVQYMSEMDGLTEARDELITRTSEPEYKKSYEEQLRAIKDRKAGKKAQPSSSVPTNKKK